MFTQKELKKALAHLSQDIQLKKLIETHEAPYWEKEAGTLFEGIVESIVSQQISVKAADAIYARFLEVYRGEFPTAAEILATSDDKIRATGISRPKVSYIKGLAEMIEKKHIDLESLRQLSDEDVIDSLITIKGVGRWTAEMLLMFEMRRPDIFSYGDLGLRNAIALLYSIDRDDLKAMESIVAKWSPYKTLASRYLWKSLQNTPKV